MVTSAIELLGNLPPSIFNSSIYDYKHTVKSTRNDDLRFRKNLNHGLSTLILVVNYNLKSCSFTKKQSPQEKIWENVNQSERKDRKTSNCILFPYDFSSEILTILKSNRQYTSYSSTYPTKMMTPEKEKKILNN